MSTRSMFTRKYRHKNKEPLEMDDGHEREGTSNPRGSHAAWDSTTREWDQQWLLWLRCLLCAPSASPNQGAKYEEAVATFILFRLDPSCLHVSAIHCYEHVPLLSYIFFSSHFLLEPEVTHRPSFPGELPLLCLPGIQLKSWLFWQSADIKVFYWKW